MIRLSVGGGAVDVLPVVNGLVAEAEKVREAYGGYEAYGASLGVEALDALSVRDQLDGDDIPVSELDIAYSKRMSAFGDVVVPSPAFCELVDLCARDGLKVIGLDFKDFDFDSAYLECVKATEFTSEHRLAKKGLKKRLDESSPEALAIDWDRHVSSVRGYAKLNARRERRIAEEIASTMEYRGSLLAVIEVERAEGAVRALREGFGAADREAPNRRRIRHDRRSLPRMRKMARERRALLRRVRPGPRGGMPRMRPMEIERRELLHGLRKEAGIPRGRRPGRRLRLRTHQRRRVRPARLRRDRQRAAL